MSISNLLNSIRHRPNVPHWSTLEQPVPLIKFNTVDANGAVKYIATGITNEAEILLSQLPAPLYIIAFSGFGRSGKSFTASNIREIITGNNDVKFSSAPGNVPCTHGIDMIIFKHPTKGHMLFLDCEGGSNHNQTAIPFVMGLAARLASKILVFERGCFTTGGLETVMQIINMGHATSNDQVDITRSIVLCENMSINAGIPAEKLLQDLLQESTGDEMTNKVRQLVKENFTLDLVKIPFVNSGNLSDHKEACTEIADSIMNDNDPFKVGGIHVDGMVVCQLVNELLTQIRGGGKTFNMVTATEALVSNMAAEAANTIWTEFVANVRKAGNHPVQINGRKHLRTVMREVEGIASTSLSTLETFTDKLQPAESALVAREIWDRNYHNFSADIRASHNRKSEEIAKYSRWGEKMNKLITTIVAHIIEAIRQFIRFARFSTTLVLMGNFYLWKKGLNMLTGFAQGSNFLGTFRLTVMRRQKLQSLGKKMAKVTPRTNIAGAHQQGVSVSTGHKLPKSSPMRIYVLIAIAGTLLATDWIPTKSYVGAIMASLRRSYTVIAYLPTGFQIVTVGLLIGMIYIAISTGRPYLVFAYNCFLKPFLSSKKFVGIDSSDHQSRLEEFYEGQANVYDVTRKRLLRGRNTMLKLCAAQLKQVYPCRFSENFKVGKIGESVTDPQFLPSPPMSPSLMNQMDKRYAWIDIGGGTGENVERMNSFFPIRNFDRVYVVDITPSLCKVAEERFMRLGWTNVTVLCMDASKFEIPEQDFPDTLEIALVTMSYSLSMMESFYPLIDRLTQILSPAGIIGIADFYVSHKRSADPTRQLGWIMRWFWSVWFDLDNIYLHPSRRDYLEHCFKTVKALNCKNNFIRPFVKIPYYVWVGAQKEGNMPIFDLDQKVVMEDSDSTMSAEEDSGTASAQVEKLKKSPVVTSEHVHGQGWRWREPFDVNLIPRFNTYIYAFTWEDPLVDLQFLDLKKEDHMMVISSGGCNVLEYAIQIGPARIHAVDLNPCQNNLLELKLAGIQSLCYEDFWTLFGEGYIPNFSTVLDTHLSPHLSPYAYHFWKQSANFKSLFKTGCSGLAIRVFSWVVKLKGLKSSVERMCNADTIEEQIQVWEADIRPHFLSSWLIRILNNDRFLWGALGVPPAQMQMIIQEGSVYEYIVNTFDPVIKNSHLKTQNYFYYMPLMHKYHVSSAPSYLTEEGFEILKSEPERLDAIKIHTDMIVNVLNNEIGDEELTKVILMDHLDWFSLEDATAEISAVARKMAKGGKVFWRSAGKHPWYISLFEELGFMVKPCQIREGESMYIDRVNMYASFWMGEKL